MISAEQRENLVAEAARAPSVHNVQPARWRFVSDEELILFRELGRELPVGDPTGHDLKASLGAAMEGMSIALSRLGLGLGAMRVEGDAQAPRCVPVLRATIEAGGTVDPLAEFVAARRSYRGRFAASTDATGHALRALQADDAHIVTDKKAIEQVATLHERATWTFESRRAYHAELWSWLRLSPSDPRWNRDGLNADCLALSALERTAANVLLRPKPFSMLSAMRLARPIVSEAAQVRSATGVILFVPKKSLEPLDVGRRFYRLWLEIARAGLYAAPMSACADDPEVNALLRDDHMIPAERRIASVLRVGIIDPSAVAVSPRLPTTEWLV